MFWLTRWFRRDAEIAALKARNRQLRSRCELLTLERDKLLEVVERDRRRIEAETKTFGASIVDAERRGSK